MDRLTPIRAFLAVADTGSFTGAARKLGVSRSAITGHIHLAADHPEGYDRYSPMTSRLMHLMIIDVMATCLALRIGGTKLQPLLKEMKNNLRSKRYA